MATSHSEVSPSGHTLYYNVQDGQAEVVPQRIQNNQPSYYSLAGNVVIPDSVTCEGVRVPVTKIGEMAFVRCASVYTFNLPATLREIGNNAFQQCSGLTMIIIPDSVTVIGTGAFGVCTNLTSVTFGHSVSSIGSSAFWLCTSLTSIALPDSLTVLSDGMFDRCTNLSQVILPQGLSGIGGSAFSQCYSLQHIELPDSLQTIANSAFNACTSLVAIQIPISLSSIGTRVFAGCINLDAITVAEGNMVFDSRDNCNGIVETATNTLVFGCKNVQIPETVTIIGEWAINFNYFTYDISYYSNSAASHSCSRLINDLALPASVTNIMQNAFNGCVRNMHMGSSTPPIVNGSIGADNYYVPCGSKNTYVAYYGLYDSQVHEFNDKFTFSVASSNDALGICEVVSDAVFGTSVRCDSTITIMATPAYGYLFDHWSDGSLDNPYTLHLTTDSAVSAFFVKRTFTVEGLSNDNTWGTVQGAGEFEYLDNVVLTPLANPGYHFTSWLISSEYYDEYSGEYYDVYYESFDTQLVVRIQRNMVVYANFNPNVYSLALHTSAQSDTNSYIYGTEVLIDANEPMGYHFTQWSDGNTENPRTIVITQDTILEAYYFKNRYYVQTRVDTSRGFVYGNDSVYYLDTAVLTVESRYGYDFSYWKCQFDDGSYMWFSEGDTLRIAVYTNCIVTAIFTSHIFNVEVSVYDSTMGMPDYIGEYGSGGYAYLDEADISAEANYGYHFTHWGDGSLENPRRITVRSDTVFTAYFAPNEYTLQVMSQDESMGTTTGSGTFQYLDSVEVRALPVEHYQLSSWSDGSTENPHKIQITGNMTLVANFRLAQHFVNAVPDNPSHGTVTGSGNYSYGTSVTATAIPYSGYLFSHWTDGSTFNPYTFAVLQDTVMTAIFIAVGEPYQDTIFFYDTISVHDTITMHDTVSVHDTITMHDTIEIIHFDTVWLHDTLYLHDTVYMGVDDVEALPVKLYQRDGKVVVEGSGNNPVTVYDVSGRQIQAIKQSDSQIVAFDVPVTGTYLVKIGNHPARKVVVIR